MTFARKYESITFIAYKSDLELKLHCEFAAEGSNIDESAPIRAEIIGDILSRAEGIAATGAAPDSPLSSSEAIACFSCGRSFLYTRRAMISAGSVPLDVANGSMPAIPHIGPLTPAGSATCRLAHTAS